jgi:tRNA nucleotidyltransferase (CCA-adding enzyme)
MKLNCENPDIPAAVCTICGEVKREGGMACVVGGGVRDSALGLPVKDIDLEVFHSPPERLLQMLSRLFEIDLVGQSFGVIKVRHLPIDNRHPPRESKNGLGHRAFAVHSDPSLSGKKPPPAATSPSMPSSFDPLTGELFDPFHGLDGPAPPDSPPIPPTAIAEDPLRVLRGMQFTARFELQVAPETIQLCRTIQPEGLPPERIFDEWKKLILLGRAPSPRPPLPE